MQQSFACQYVVFVLLSVLFVILFSSIITDRLPQIQMVITMIVS